MSELYPRPVWYHPAALNQMPNARKALPYVMLLAAFGLRAWQLAGVPPGLTHDEAGHGYDAAQVLQGITPIYFTVGYGREPLFDYVNAGLLAVAGVSPLVLRCSSVLWGTIALAATWRLARTVFDWKVGGLALAFMGASFWPLATSRQILRSSIMPAEMALAVLMFVLLGKATSWRARALLALGMALAVAASLYTYIPARALWLMFPLTLFIALALAARGRLPGGARPQALSLASLALAFALAAPLFIHLVAHPEAETRIEALSSPLTALQSGDTSILIDNAIAFALALVVPGRGDTFLAYTIPGRPLFDWLSFALFAAGVATLLRHAGRSSNAILLLLWLALGLAPSVVTGPEALSTRIMGAQPAVYITSALGGAELGRWLLQVIGSLGSQLRAGWSRRLLGWGAASLYTVGLLAGTARDYFTQWADSPDVRAAYQSTLIDMLSSLSGPAVISTLHPSAPHDPYIGALVTRLETRWVDGRLATVVRADGGGRPPFQLFAPASTPLHPVVVGFYRHAVHVTLRPDDLDPSYDIYRQVSFEARAHPATLPTFNEALQVGAQAWLSDSYRPGDVAELFIGLTVLEPARLGALHPPAFKTELRLFAHILATDGSIWLQQDRLDAPSWQWQAGDTVIQILQFAVPPDAAPANYALSLGVYDFITGERLLTADGSDHVDGPPLVIR